MDNNLSQDTLGRLGGSLGRASDFSSGHDLAVCGFEPRVGLCADSSEPGACFGFCLLLSLPHPTCALSKINKCKKNFFFLKKTLLAHLQLPLSFVLWSQVLHHSPVLMNLIFVYSRNIYQLPTDVPRILGVGGRGVSSTSAYWLLLYGRAFMRVRTGTHV